MQSIACTLFEGNYNKGVAALINSLYSNNFKGAVVVGFRGEMPTWTKSLTKIEGEKLEIQNAIGYFINRDIKVYFLELHTNFHFTNYKPCFILQLKKSFDATLYDGIFYFDPDIVNICDWSFYQHWISCGVAVVHEIVWNDMPPNHPKRKLWLKIAESVSLKVHNNVKSNLNAGFVGVTFGNISFIELWARLIDAAIANFGMNENKFSQSEHDWDIFKVADQDLFNLAAMTTELPLAEFGPDGMGFIGGGWLMLHATGSPKPWNKNYFLEFLKGNKASLTDKEFWNYADGIIRFNTNSSISFKKFSLKATSFLGRFYSK